MQKFVLVTSEKQRLLIDENEYKALVKAIDANKKYAIVQGFMIPLAIAPSISPFEAWYETETERLANSEKRLCKKCLKIMNIYDKCLCWEQQGTGREQHALKPILPDSVRERLSEISAQKSMPAAQAQITAQEAFAEYSRKPKITTPEVADGANGMLGYRDEESGEIFYS